MIVDYRSLDGAEALAEARKLLSWGQALLHPLERSDCLPVWSNETLRTEETSPVELLRLAVDRQRLI